MNYITITNDYEVQSKHDNVESATIYRMTSPDLRVYKKINSSDSLTIDELIELKEIITEMGCPEGFYRVIGLKSSVKNVGVEVVGGEVYLSDQRLIKL